MSAAVSRQFPGTTVELAHLRAEWPMELSAELLRWRDDRGEVVLVARDPKVRGWAPSISRWVAQAQVERLSIDFLDRYLVKKELRASGFLKGPVTIAGKGFSVTEVDFQLQVESPGGTVSSALIERLLAMMPEGSSRRRLLAVMRQSPDFHFHRGAFEVSTRGEIYEVHFLIDGEHLLDFTIRFPKESVELLKEVFS